MYILPADRNKCFVYIQKIQCTFLNTQHFVFTIVKHYGTVNSTMLTQKSYWVNEYTKFKQIHKH